MSMLYAWDYSRSWRRPSDKVFAFLELIVQGEGRRKKELLKRSLDLDE